MYEKNREFIRQYNLHNKFKVPIYNCAVLILNEIQKHPSIGQKTEQLDGFLEDYYRQANSVANLKEIKTVFFNDGKDDSVKVTHPAIIMAIKKAFLLLETEWSFREHAEKKRKLGRPTKELQQLVTHHLEDFEILIDMGFTHRFVAEWLDVDIGHIKMAMSRARKSVNNDY